MRYDSENFFNVRLRGQGFITPRDDGYEFDRCVFAACLATCGEDGVHLRVDSVRSNRCRVEGGSLLGVHFKDSSFHDLSITNDTQILGCIFENVSLSGRTPSLMIRADFSWTYNPAPLREAFEASMSSIPMALDLSALRCPDLTIRGIPSRLIRRNPREQFVVRRECLEGSGWQSVDCSRTIVGIVLRELESSPWEDVLVPLPAKADRRARTVEVLRQLVRLQVVKPEDSIEGIHS